MTPVQNYAQIVNNIFGTNSATFDLTKTHSNKIIGALNQSNFSTFKSNFLARLKRLQEVYSKNPKSLIEILVQVNEIQSEKNWEGASAELAAYDYLNSNLDYLFEPIQPNITLSNKLSFAKDVGKQETNLDGFIKEHNIYFDVKCLKDNVKEILQGIYKELKTHLGTDDFVISEEYALDVSYQDFQIKRRDLILELKREITVTEKKTHLKSKIIPNLSYKILWGSGINTAIRTYDPYSHAEVFHKTIFNYTNKFMKSKPTLIVLVVFPWYNLVVNDFGDSNLHFFRALSRRFFCQYKHDKSKFKDFNSSFTKNDSFFKISKHLSGIIILEDKSILGTKPNEHNVKAHIYLNPNAKNQIRKTSTMEYFNSLHPDTLEDFFNDNY